MGSGVPIPARKRALIVEQLRRGDKLAQIARRHGVSPSAVKAIRIAEGLQPLPTEESKERARAARDVMLLDARRRRAELMISLLEDAEKLRTRLWSPAKVFGFGGRDYEYREQELSEPDFKGKQALMISLGIAVDKSLQLEKYDQEGSAAGRAAIIELVDRLGAEERAAAC